MEFYEKGLSHGILPDSLRRLFEQLARGSDVNAAGIPNLSDGAATSGIRLIKAALMTGRRIDQPEDVFTLMSFDPNASLRALQRKVLALSQT